MFCMNIRNLSSIALILIIASQIFIINKYYVLFISYFAAAVLLVRSVFYIQIYYIQIKKKRKTTISI